QRLCGEEQGAVDLPRKDEDIRGHPRLQLQVLVGRADDRGIGYDVRGDGRFETDLVDGPRKGNVRIGIDGEGDALAGADVPDIGFRHGRLDLHLRDVFCNDEQGRGAEACRDRLTHADI